MLSAMSKKSTITIKNGNTFVSCQLIRVSLPFYGNMAITYQNKKEVQTWLAMMRNHMFFSSLGSSIKYVDTFFPIFWQPLPNIVSISVLWGLP